MVRCCDGTLIDQEFDTTAKLSLLLGRLVLIVSDKDGQLSLRFVTPARPRKFAYWQIIDRISGSIVEEFAYRRKAEAEERLAALQALHPGRYQLEIYKRYEW
ncbi:MAG TPA: hypothetical protein VJ739_14520 [Gemmataceae bacterium]|nr:hypothetical protein [Gemmataceae bacterium]